MACKYILLKDLFVFFNNKISAEEIINNERNQYFLENVYEDSGINTQQYHFAGCLMLNNSEVASYVMYDDYENIFLKYTDRKVKQLNIKEYLKITKDNTVCCALFRNDLQLKKYIECIEDTEIENVINITISYIDLDEKNIYEDIFKSSTNLMVEKILVSYYTKTILESKLIIVLHMNTMGKSPNTFPNLLLRLMKIVI